MRSYLLGRPHLLAPSPRSAQDTQFGFSAAAQAAKSNGIMQNKLLTWTTPAVDRSDRVFFFLLGTLPPSPEGTESTCVERVISDTL